MIVSLTFNRIRFLSGSFLWIGVGGQGTVVCEVVCCIKTNLPGKFKMEIFLMKYLESNQNLKRKIKINFNKIKSYDTFSGQS